MLIHVTLNECNIEQPTHQPRLIDKMIKCSLASSIIIYISYGDVTIVDKQSA